MRKVNPFLVYGYVSPDLFCDREVETKTLVSALLNGRNVTLISARRMGKTGLIHNVFHRMGQDYPEIKCFYMDIFSTNSLREFTLMLANTVVGKFDSFGEKMLSRLSEFFKSCRPVVSVDAMTGAPSITLDFVPSNAESTLKEIFIYLQQSGKECIIAIDEFQQITEYAEAGTEALIRSYIQFMPNVHFIFSGSKRHIMTDMFSSPKRPFYQSTQKMNIDRIDEAKYLEFAQRHLKDNGIELPEDVFHGFYEKLYGHTWYVQRVLNKIYEVCEGTVTSADVDSVIGSIVGEEEYNYQKQYSMLTLNQQNLLKAVAREQTVKNINGKQFIRQHNLGGTSSINRALESLMKNEFIIESPEGYQVYDRFMNLWLDNG